MKKKKIILILIFASLIFALSLVVLLLWNNIITIIFGLKAINYFQALGLLILSKILFGNFGKGNSPHWKYRKHYTKENFMHLNAEDKEKIAREWLKRNPENN